MQLKYSLKKEWSHFLRTFRFLGVIIAVFATALVYLLLFKFTGTVFESMGQGSEMALSVANSAPNDYLGGLNELDNMWGMFLDAGMMYSTVMSSVLSISLLVIMLVLGSPAGGEQKKRAMIIPTCSGLDNKSYVLAKFIIYPVTSFVTVFLCEVLCGALCNAFFPNNKLDTGLLLLGSVLAGLFMLFEISVFLSLGICTSKPGIMTAVVYFGTSLLQTLMESLGITDFNPFTLYSLVAGEMFADPDFSLSDNAASIAVGSGLSLLISVLMCLLAIAVLNAKKIDNTEEKKPEF